MSEERTILIVESDEKLREEIINALNDLPCRFVEINGAGDAITALAIDAPEAAVISMELPDGDGIELIRSVRTFDPKIYIIVMIGQPTKEKILMAKHVRASDILLKPPDLARLKTKLSGLLWLDPSLVKKDRELSFEEEQAKLQTEIQQKAEEEPFVEAIPKGAEIANINDVIAGMKIAKTLMFNDVVYGDKGQVLDETRIRQLNKMGVPEVCVYTDPVLKKKVEDRKKAQAMASSIKTTDTGAAVSTTQHTGPQAEKTFAKVKRSSVRVDVNAPVKMSYIDPLSGESVEEDAFIADVSAGGCALLTQNKMEKGQEITLDFTLDDGKFPMKGIKGIVRHSMKRFGTDAFPSRNGIFFTNITERFRENLITVLFRLEREVRQKEKDKNVRKPRSFKLVD